MDLRTRVCIWVIVLSFANFLAYVVGYSILWGEAVNGEVSLQEGRVVYTLQSNKEVSRGQFIYSGIHSISIWPTMMAAMLAMLTLAKDRIVDSMHAAVVRGRTVCTILAVVISICCAGMTFLFLSQFSAHLAHAELLQRQVRAAPASQPASGPAAAIRPDVSAAHPTGSFPLAS